MQVKIKTENNMREIYAISGIHCVIDSNQPRRIGSISDYSHFYNSSGQTVSITKVTLDFDRNGATDEFFFENDKLAFSSVSNQREKYMRVDYRDFVAKEKLTLEQFITAIKEAYVFYTMGFAHIPPEE